MADAIDLELSRRGLLVAGAASVAVSASAASDAQGAPAETVPTAKVAFEVNGVRRELELDTRTTLLDAMREHLHLTGSKKGCDHGQCGACTVMVRGHAHQFLPELWPSCTRATASRRSRGWARPSDLHPMQAAFIKHDGYQCGYCTPGQICSAVAVLDEIKAGRPEPRQRQPRRLRSAQVTTEMETARAHERQHLPVRCLFQHRRRHRRRRRSTRGGEQHEALHASNAPRLRPQAAAAAARTPGSKFIAGGTNLLDLMKLQIETPASPRSTSTGSGLDTDRARLRTVRLAHRRPGEQHRSRRRCSRAARLRRCCRARMLSAGASGQLAQQGHHGRQPAPAHALSRISTTPTMPCNKRLPGSRLPGHRRRQPTTRRSSA